MQKIGLEGVFKTEAFASGLNKYLGGLALAGTRTMAVAGSIASTLGTAVVAGGAAFAAVGAAAVAASFVVGGAITKMVFDAAKLGDTYSQMSGITGISTDRLQELAYAGKLLDVDLETITSGLRFLTRNMYTAREGTGEQAEAFAQLGVKVTDAAGRLRDGDVVFGETIDALGKIKNETLRDALAMKIMGRSAMELNPLIRAGSKLLAQYSEEAGLMGAVVEGSGVESLDIFQDRMDALKLSAKGIMATLALNFLPFFEDIQDAGRSLVKDFVATGDINRLGTGISNVFTGIVKGLTKSAPQTIKSVTKFLVSINKILIKNLPMFIKAGGQLLTSILKGLAGSLPEIFSTGLDVIDTIYKSVVAALPSILKAGGEVITALGKGIMDAVSRLPSLNTILTTLFEKAADLSASILKWVGEIDWGKVSQSIADYLRDLDWSNYGTQFTAFITNLAKAIWKVLTETEWGTLFTSIGTSIGDFIAGAIKPGEDWSTIWKTQWGPTLDLLKQMIKDYGWEEVGRAIAWEIFQGLFGWLIRYFTENWGAIKARFNQMFLSPGALPAMPGNLPGVTRPVPTTTPVIPQKTIPSPTVPNRSYAPGAGGSMAKTVNNNISITNPAPEAASTSVAKTLKNLSYLGVGA